MSAPRGTSRRVRTKNISASRNAGAPYSRTLGLEALRVEQEIGRDLRRRELAGLGEMSLNAIHDMQGAINDEAVSDLPIQEDDGHPDWEPVPDQDEDFAHAIRELIAQDSQGRVYKDARTWKQRIDRLEENWAPKISEMTDAYLQWKYHDSTASSSGSDVEMESDSYDFTIGVLDIYTLTSSVNVKRDSSSPSAAHALALNGFIGNSPEQPSLALSIRTLELFLHLRKRKPSLSIEAFAKVISDAYNIPYLRKYRAALSNAFDAYLAIMQAVKQRVATALGRDQPNWRALNSCKACCYELEDEPYIRWRRMLALDANFSLKRVASGKKHTGDTRTFAESDYFLTDAEIARYADEVSRPARAPPVPSETPINPSDDNQVESDEETEEGETVEGDPADGQAEGTGTDCGSRWKAAAADEKKKMWNVFDESGLFACACRHGFILWIADLVQSGELAKFPLAMVGRAMEVLGDRLLIGYDIGCAFGKTIASSSLGSDFKAAKCRCCVNAFHGYSHSYDCQKANHPNVIEGMGLEDLETLERVFSASNALGGVTRYMTAYRRRVFIDLFFAQWDLDKHSNIGLMLHNNYRQAIQILEEEEPAFREAMEKLNITREQLDQWHKDEAEYFKNLGAEASFDVKRVAYVELLQKYRELQAANEKLSNILLTTPDEVQATYASALSQTRRRETERKFLNERMEQIHHEILLFEDSMNIQERWSPQSKDYIEALAYANEREYHRALDKLQKLVIQRLFELQKLNLSGTGYHLRSHIAKALQRRCKAIRNAVKKYNAAALKMNPPRATLDWSKVSHFTFLEEFELLRGSQQGLINSKWADATIRQTLKQDLRIKRAQEEIEYCNIAIRRVSTAILDEHDLFDRRLAELKTSHDPIYGPLSDFVKIQKGINYQILARFDQTYQLKGFTGNRTRGTRKGAFNAGAQDSAPINDQDQGIAQAARELEHENTYMPMNTSDLGESEEQDARDLIQMIDYVAELPRLNIDV